MYKIMDNTLQIETSLFEYRRSKLDKHMKGILTNVLGMLFRLGWNLVHIDIWQTPIGETYTFQAAKNNISTLLYDIIDSYNALQYDRAAQHYDGADMQHGIQWQYTLSIVYAWRKSKVCWTISLLAALETTMAGAAWPQARVGDTFQDQPTSCSLCGEIGRASCRERV